MAWARLASRSRLRPAAAAVVQPRRASPPTPTPPPPVPAPSSPPLSGLLLLLPRRRFAAAASSPARLLGDRCWAAGDARRWFASETSAAPATAGEAAELVEVPLAQTGEGIAECELLRWFVTEGDQVDEFQPLCEVQSDKATIEITSRFKGKVHQILFGPGDIIKVGETLLQMIVGDSQIISRDNIAPPTDKSLGVDSTSPSGEGNIPSGTLSTPAVRHLAKQYGLNINDVQGTGKDGRVLKEDVLNHAASKGLFKEQSSVLEENIGHAELLEEGKSLLHVHRYEDKKISLRGYQRSMVKSMSLAAKVPHFHYLEEINCDALVELKSAFQNENKDHNIKHTFLPFLIKSLSMALSKYPLLNSSFIDETNEVVLKGSHNIGVAMATEHGLVVPNIKTVQSLSILEITKELARLHEMASQNRLSAGDIAGGTVTLSNIGAIGGKFGSPLLNLPEVAIIALGRIQKLPCFDDDENVYPSSRINVTVGADHRVVDGATVARFCNEWKSLVEKPELLLRAARARQHPRAGGGLSPATYYAGFGHCESDKGGWRQGGGGGRVRGEEQDEGQESRRRAAGGDICGAGRVRARREHRGGAARARRAGAGAAQEADRALRPHRVLLPCRGKSRRHSHGGRRARPCLPHRARRETLQLHHALLRPAVCRVPRRGVGSARARRRVAVRDAHLVRRASRGRLDFHPEEKTPLQGGVLRLQRGCGHQIHGEADRGAERGLRAGLGHRQRDRQQRLPDSRGAEGLRFVGQVCVGVREQQAAVAELQVQPEDPSEDVQVGVHQQGHGPARLPLRRPHRHPLLHASRRPHQRSPRLLPAPPCLLLRRPRKLIF